MSFKKVHPDPPPLIRQESVRFLKLFLSILLLIVWSAATIILGITSIILVIPMIIFVFFPELTLFWFLAALFLLEMGGWLDESENDSENDWQVWDQNNG